MVIVSFYRLRKRNRAIIAEKVRVTGWRVEIHLKIPLPDDPHDDDPPEPGPDPNNGPSSDMRLRSLGEHRRQDSYRLAQATTGKGVKPLN